MARAKKQKLSLEELLEEVLVKVDEYPYEIPSNWVWVKLIDGFAECLDSYRKPVNAKERSNREGNIPYYGATGQVGWIDDFLTDEHLVLVGEDGAPFFDYIKNKAYIIEGKAWVNNHAHILKSYYGEVSNKYLMHYLNIFNYNGYVNGTTRLKLTQSSMKLMPIPLPPLAEQQRIIQRIESLFEKLDCAKAIVQNALDSFENRKAVILHKAFTGELTAKWREENKVDFDTWEEKKLKEICTISSGGTPSRKKPEYYTGNIPWIKTGEIRWNYIYDAEEKITQEAIDNSSAKLVEKGAVLVAMYGQGLTRGRAAILDTVAATNQAVCILKVNENSFNKFIYYYFMYNYWKFREEAVGGNQPNLSGKIISDFTIKLPLLEEQREIVTIIDSLLEKEQQAQEFCDIIEKINLMKKAILARAFKGELGTNNREEESAIELLKEVLKEKL